MLAHETARLSSLGSSTVRLFFFLYTFGIMSAQEDGVKMGQVTVWARLGHLDGLTGGPGVHLYRK